MSSGLVHRCRKYNYEPCAIQCLAVRLEKDQPLVALARSDASIEVWAVTGEVWFPLQTIISEKGQVINSLIWVKDRLISGIQSSQITEYDLNTNRAKYSVETYGGDVWCMAYCEKIQRVAIGCEDGGVRLFSTETPKLSFDRGFARATGRIISISWHPNGNTLVTGSFDVITIWDTRSIKGRVVRRISLERERKQDATIIWSLVILNDYTVVSGDSYGRVQFWSASNGTLLQSFRAHRADVLSLCVSEEQTSIYAAGIDPRVLEFRLINSYSGGGDGPSKWVKGRETHSHTHDIRALTCCRNTLFSGGVDTKLIVNSMTKNKAGKKLHKMLPFPAKPLASSSMKRSLVLFQYPKHLELMKLAKEVDMKDLNDQPKEIAVEEKERILLRIAVPKSDLSQIVTSAISPCGNWIAYSTTNTFRLFYLHYDADTLQLKLERIHSENPPACTSFAFSNDGNLLVVVTPTHRISSFLLQESCQRVELLNSVHAQNMNFNLHLVEISCDKKYFALANLGGEIDIYSTIDLSCFCSLPRYGNTPATALSFDENYNLMVSYSNMKVCEFSLTTQAYTEWSRAFHSTNEDGLVSILKSAVSKKRSNLGVVTKISKLHFRNHKDDQVESLAFVSHDGIYIIERSTNAQKEHSSSRFCKKFCPIIHANFDEEKMFVVEQPLDRLEELLPPPLYQKKFGT